MKNPFRRRRPDPAPAPQVEDVPVSGGTIRLGQLLKLANLVDQGSDAKEVLAAGLVRVNGEVDARRGRQLAAGDVVTLEGAAPVRVVAE